MDDTTYNGRTNRETRLVNLHYNPETKDDVERIKQSIEDIENNIQGGFLKDFVDFGKINRDEVEDNLEG